MRYRTADWLHRIYIFAQLIIFSALAAFTRKFDITSGIVPDRDAAEAQLFLTDLQFDQSTLEAQDFRNDRLPKLNARGISMAMAASRILLLVQYIVGRHTRRSSHEPQTFLKSPFSQFFITHVATSGRYRRCTSVHSFSPSFALSLLSHFLGVAMTRLPRPKRFSKYSFGIFHSLLNSLPTLLPINYPVAFDIQMKT
jgi:hypothetical protein